MHPCPPRTLAVLPALAARLAEEIPGVMPEDDAVGADHRDRLTAEHRMSLRAGQQTTALHVQEPSRAASPRDEVAKGDMFLSPVLSG
jgi:hypothetical protein